MDENFSKDTVSKRKVKVLNFDLSAQRCQIKAKLQKLVRLEQVTALSIPYDQHSHTFHSFFGKTIWQHLSILLVHVPFNPAILFKEMYLMAMPIHLSKDAQTA